MWFILRRMLIKLDIVLLIVKVNIWSIFNKVVLILGLFIKCFGFLKIIYFRNGKILSFNILIYLSILFYFYNLFLWIVFLFLKMGVSLN